MKSIDPQQKRVVIVTGAGSGIGLAVVKKLVKENFVIACTRSNTKMLEGLLKNIPLSIKENLSINTFEIENSDYLKVFINKIYKEYKRIDVLINCAAASHGGLFNLTKIEEIKSIFETNFFSQLELSQLVSRFMIRKKNGCIINVSSISSFKNDSGNIAYGSSKSALNYATKIMAKELGNYGINVNAVAPGVTNTPMLSKMDKFSIDDQIKRSSNKKIGEPEQIASLIQFLCSKDSSHITGQIIKIDGGQ